MTEPELDPVRIDAFRQSIDGTPEPVPPYVEPTPPTDGPIRTPVRRARNLLRKVRNRLRRGAAAVRRYDPRAVSQLSIHLDAGIRDLETRFEQLRAEFRALAVWVGADDPRNLGRRVDAIGTNLELLKAELRGAERTLGSLGDAIAPGAGLDAAAPRMAELRERLNALDRRVRQIAAAPPVPTDASAAADQQTASPEGAVPVEGAVSPEGTATGGSGFDYIGFEQRFRGDPDAVLDMSRDRYLQHLTANQPVLDIGCGRGELLRMLADHGVAGSGVDLDGGMVAEAVAGGVDAHHGDAIEFLRNQPEHSFGAITAIHVVEHLELDLLIELLELAATRLKPGGVLIAETPNPATLLVLGNSYILDPTHVWPLHPSLLSFLCERAGFRDVELVYGSPADDYHLDLLPTDGPTAEVAAALNPSLERLNRVLFGPQEYAVVARTPEG